MGTRADFYVKKGSKCEWLGSIAWDGDLRWVGEEILLTPHTEASFREKVTIMLGSRDDGTTPDLGWPWPWNNSRITDYAYYWTPSKRGVNPYGNIVVAYFGEKLGYTKGDDGKFRGYELDEEHRKLPNTFFPDMSKIQNVDFEKRSGLILIPVRR